MAGLAVSNGLTPVAGAIKGQELMSKYLDWLSDEEAFDQLLGLNCFFNVVMNQNLSVRLIPTEFKVQDKCHVLAQDQKAASDTIPEDPIPRALCRVCSSGSVVHPKEC